MVGDVCSVQQWLQIEQDSQNKLFAFVIVWIAM